MRKLNSNLRTKHLKANRNGNKIIFYLSEITRRLQFTYKLSNKSSFSKFNLENTTCSKLPDTSRSRNHTHHFRRQSSITYVFSSFSFSCSCSFYASCVSSWLVQLVVSLYGPLFDVLFETYV